MFGQTFAARGMALGDFNNDGAIDVLIAVNNGSRRCSSKIRPREKTTGSDYGFIGKKANPDAVGARITWQAGVSETQPAKGGRGKLFSSHDIRVKCWDW